MNSKSDVIKALEAEVWHFAKTMPNIPHSYTRKREWSEPSRFIDAAVYVASNGVKEKFLNRTYTYLYSDLHKYWVMDSDPSIAQIINRAEL